MSARANSLHTVVVDTLFFTGIMALTAASWTAVANGAEPRIVHVAEAADENRPSSDHVDSRLNTDDKPASGIPEETPAAKRESMMLGMKLFERSAGQIEVVDVAAASPAWEAGIRRGDRLREIDGIKPERLATWVADVGKVLASREDGKSVAAEVERDGYPMEVRITLPVSNVAAARDARKQDEELARMQAREQRQLKNGQQPGAPVGVGGIDRNDYGPGPAYGGYGGYGGWGFGGFFDDGAGAANHPNGEDRMARSAAASLMAVDPAAFPGGASGGGQIGMAGFQENGQSVDAMVVVRGLPQGSYQVGIGAGGQFGMNGNSGVVGPDIGADGQFGLNPALEGTAETYDQGGAGANRGANPPGASYGVRGPNGTQPGNAVNPNPQNPAGNQPLDQQQPGIIPQGNIAPGAGTAPDASGGAGAGGGAAPSGGDGASLANPRNAILAQQLDSANPAGGQATNNPAPANPQQAVQQNSYRGQPTDGAAGPGANPYDPRDRAEAQRRGQSNNPLNSGGATPGFASLGTLQVGPDGSGQVTSRLEGMTVRNLSGMQVFVQSTNFRGGLAGADNRAAGRNQAANDRAAQRNMPAGQRGEQPGFAFPGELPGRGMEGVVAVGTIQLRGGGGGAPPQTGERPMDEATRREQGRSQISDPTQQFNPSSPLE